MDVVFAPYFVGINNFRRCFEIKVRMFEDFLRHEGQEFKDARFGPLMFSEGFIIHKQVHRLPIAGDLMDPVGKCWSGKWPGTPVLIGETKGDIVRQRVILQQGFYIPVSGWMVKKVGASFSEDVIKPFAQNSFVPQPGDEVGDLIVINKFSISEDCGGLVKQLFNFGFVFSNLSYKLFL